MQVLMLCRPKTNVLYRKMGKEVKLGMKDMSLNKVRRWLFPWIDI